jgi:multidrug transporter EmrE-like cation transporter
MEGLSSFQSGLVLTLTEFFGDYGAKTQNPVLGYGGYAVLQWELQSMLRNNPLSLVNAYWDGISNIMTLGLGYAMGERLSNQQLAGAFLITAGIMFLRNGKQTL